MDKSRLASHILTTTVQNKPDWDNTKKYLGNLNGSEKKFSITDLDKA